MMPTMINPERNPTISESPPQPTAPQPVQFIAEKVIDRLSDAEEKHIIDIQSVWPSFKSKEKLSKDELYEAFPKIAEEVRYPDPQSNPFTFCSKTKFEFRVSLRRLVGYARPD